MLKIFTNGRLTTSLMSTSYIEEGCLFHTIKGNLVKTILLVGPEFSKCKIQGFVLALVV